MNKSSFLNFISFKFFKKITNKMGNIERFNDCLNKLIKSFRYCSLFNKVLNIVKRCGNREPAY